MSEVRVTMNDLRTAGHCASGIREFFKVNNLDLVKLVREGLTEEDLAHVHDVNMDRVKEIAAARVANGL